MQQPDVIAIDTTHTVRQAAHAAALHVQVQAAGQYFGTAALTKAAEIRKLVSALQRAGLAHDAVGLEGMTASSTGGLLGSTSSATYQLVCRCTELANLGELLDVITASKHASLDRVAWLYPEDAALQATWLAAAVKDAAVKAEAIATALGCRLAGVHRVEERVLHGVARGRAPQKMAMSKARSVDLGFELGSTRDTGVAVNVQFHVESL